MIPVALYDGDDPSILIDAAAIIHMERNGKHVSILLRGSDPVYVQFKDDATAIRAFQIIEKALIDA
jgi:hypothetical protein